MHDVLIPEKMRSVKPGDQVLVGWVGNTAVVLDEESMQAAFNF